MPDQQRQDDANAFCVHMLRELADRIESGKIHVEESDVESEISEVTQPGDQWVRKECTGRQWWKLTVMNKAQHERFTRALAGEHPNGDS